MKSRPSAHDAVLIANDADGAVYASQWGEVILHNLAPEEVDGDVAIIWPRQQIAQRLIRARSKNNTILITERCDQLCMMCSQPPKNHHVDHFEHIATALSLAPRSMTIGVTGGEPTLYKEKLFKLLERALEQRSDLSFHVLTNAQHFDKSDIPILRTISQNTTWGVPLYSQEPHTHDHIVGKSGAFSILERAFGLLLDAGVSIELRTVLLRSNIGDLTELAKLIARRLPFVSQWSLMQLEPIGFGRMNWNREFFDHSVDFDHIARAVSLAESFGVRTKLFNFPLCTIPEKFRGKAVASISDWKKKFLPECEGCKLKADCGGFFEWYKPERGFERIVVQ